MNLTEYLIECTAEEAGEIALEFLKTFMDLQKVCCKTNRFGLDDRNVLDPTGPTNRERLVEELNDVLGLAEMMADAGIIPTDWMDPAKVELKRAKVAKFIGYAIGTGALQSPLNPGHFGDVQFPKEPTPKPISLCTHGVAMDQHCPRCRHIPAVESHLNPRQG